MADLARHYPESSRGTLSRRDRPSDVLVRYGKPPLFNSGWLIECQVGISVALVKKILERNPSNLLVFRATNSRLLSDVCKQLAGLDFKVVDNYSLEYSDIIGWIKGELHCSGGIADAIYNRTGGNINSLVEAVNTLSVLGQVEMSDVGRYVSRAKRYGPDDLALWVACMPRKGMGYRDAVRVVYDYRYGLGWLTRYLGRSLDSCLAVFSYACNGELNMANYRHFMETTDDRAFRGLSEYRVKKILSMFGTVSYEYLLYVRGLLGSFDGSGQMVGYRLIQLIKLGG